MTQWIPEPSSFLIFASGVGIFLIVMMLARRKKNPDVDRALEQLTSAEEAVSEAYGALPFFERVRLLVSGFSPYMILLFFTEISRSFDIVSDVFGGRLIFSAIRILRPAYADNLDSMHGDLRNIFAIVFLILFVVAFFITLRDEFFTSKPRPISKDLNRAFIGFVIGQLTKLGI